ncbi:MULTISPECIES: DUF1963 domain-containing protein [unclassified Novosphingobium]|uniref:DUF1963 domain-containing protein n=1 Tax=unclassified Novosphingobium TaxID=2644732 RepID=UPI00146AAC4B|nr:MULTISPECIES: DUF1963 domain-containing protein [unclassified Novosphingobium]NMN03479.1 hypothetical protein [Novosphingobium sp. SG919]NMN86531.1 hypothetical protein [Novosphingobium sp. SG916]
MRELAALAGIGLALVAALGALVVLLIIRRRKAASLAEPELAEDAPAPIVRRRSFGPGSAVAQSQSPAADAAPDLPAFVAAAQAAAAHEAATAPPAAETAAPARLPATIAGALRQAVVFRQAFPPAPAGARSFYGGVPFTPAPLDWPRSPRTGLPLHFLLQVDCAAVAPRARLGVLPGSGALLFFADLAAAPGTGHPAHGRVIWLDEADDATWTEADPPGDLPPAYGDATAQAWPWALDAADAPQVLPRWPFAPAVIELTAAAHDPAAPPLTWPEGSTTADALLAAQGSPVAVFALSPNDFNVGDDGLMDRPWPGFPHDWLAIQTLVAMLSREAGRTMPAAARTLWPQAGEDERRALLARIASECGEWHALARTKPAFADVTEPVRQAFWEWFSGYAPLARLVAPRGCVTAVETTLHALPGSTAPFPDELVARLAYRHALAVRTAARVHARVPDRLLAAPSETEIDQSDRTGRELLLLELSADEALGHHLGDHVLQFWIAPDDLAERRFETAEMIAPAV